MVRAWLKNTRLISQDSRDSGVLHRARQRAEQDQAAVRQHQRNAEREDDLRIVALGLGRDDTRAGDVADQEAVHQPADRKHDRPGQDGARDRTDIGAEKGQHAEAGHQVVGGVHAEHHEIALGEVHHPHDAEDDAEPDAHQAVDAADRDAGGERLENVDQEPVHIVHAPAPFRTAVTPAPSARRRTVSGRRRIRPPDRTPRTPGARHERLRRRQAPRRRSRAA